MTLRPESLARRLLSRRYPRVDVIVRQVGELWSAEVVGLNQSGPPYRTWVVAEAETPEALLAKLEEHQP